MAGIPNRRRRALRASMLLVAAVGLVLVVASVAGAATDPYGNGDTNPTTTSTSATTVVAETAPATATTAAPYGGGDVTPTTIVSPAAASSGQLPNTGSSSLPLGLVGAGAVVLGLSIVGLSRPGDAPGAR